MKKEFYSQAMGKNGGGSDSSSVPESLALSLGTMMTTDGVISKADIPFHSAKKSQADSVYSSLGHMLIQSLNQSLCPGMRYSGWMELSFRPTWKEGRGHLGTPTGASTVGKETGSQGGPNSREHWKGKSVFLLQSEQQKVGRGEIPGWCEPRKIQK